MSQTTEYSKLKGIWFKEAVQLRLNNYDKEYMQFINIFKDHDINVYKMKTKTNPLIISKKKIKGIKVSKVVHIGWLEWTRLQFPKDNNEKNSDLQKLFSRYPDGPFGKYQYTYTSTKGRISMVKLNNYQFSWEIFAYENPNLFQDVLRFPNKKLAEKKIIELLK